jgi:hypothetical protein
LIALPIEEEHRNECRKHHCGEDVRPFDECQPRVYASLKGRPSSGDSPIAHDYDQEHAGCHCNGHRNLQRPFEQPWDRHFLPGHNQYRRFNHGGTSVVIRFSIYNRSALKLPPPFCALTSCTILEHVILRGKEVEAKLQRRSQKLSRSILSGVFSE